MRTGKKKSYAMFIGSCVLLLLSGCHSAEEPERPEIDKTVDLSFYNQTMGNGIAAKTDSYLYYAGEDFNLHEVDLQSLENMTLGNNIDAICINVRGDTLYYSDWYDDGIKALSLMDLSVETVYDQSTIIGLYLTDEYAYSYLSGIGGSLLRVNLSTGEYEELISESILQYAKYGDDIYYVTESDENPELTVLKKYNENSELTEQIPVGILPITVVVCENEIFMAEQGTWRLYKYQMDTGLTEAVEEIRTLYYQVRNGSLYYLDEDDKEMNYFLKKYTFADASTSILDENVFEFCLFDDESIVTLVPGQEYGAEFHYITQNGSSVEVTVIGGTTE